MSAFPQAPGAYDATNEARFRKQVADEFDARFRKGEWLRLQGGEVIILKDSVTSELWALTVQAGVVVLEGV